MLPDGLTNSNLPAAIEGVAASAQVENPRLNLPIVSEMSFRIVASEQHASVCDGRDASALQLTRLGKAQI
jgi:hypothetical protein